VTLQVQRIYEGVPWGITVCLKRIRQLDLNRMTFTSCYAQTLDGTTPNYS
jgi:hypothetical protein